MLRVCRSEFSPSHCLVKRFALLGRDRSRRIGIAYRYQGYRFQAVGQIERVAHRLPDRSCISSRCQDRATKPRGIYAPLLWPHPHRYDLAVCTAMPRLRNVHRTPRSAPEPCGPSHADMPQGLCCAWPHRRAATKRPRLAVACRRSKPGGIEHGQNHVAADRSRRIGPA